MQIPEKLLDYLQPSLRCLDAAHLDSGKCLVQLLGDRSHFVHAAWEADLFAVVNNLSNRRDNSSSTAKTALCEVFYFIEVYFSFLCLKSKVFLGNIDQGTACDGWKDPTWNKAEPNPEKKAAVIIFIWKKTVCFLFWRILFLLTAVAVKQKSYWQKSF